MAAAYSPDRGDRVKPGAQAPGKNRKNGSEAPTGAAPVIVTGAAPVGASLIISGWNLGLAPQALLGRPYQG
jgi:hypothetical protein